MIALALMSHKTQAITLPSYSGHQLTLHACFWTYWGDFLAFFPKSLIIGVLNFSYPLEVEWYPKSDYLNQILGQVAHLSFAE